MQLSIELELLPSPACAHRRIGIDGDGSLPYQQNYKQWNYMNCGHPHLHFRQNLTQMSDQLEGEK